MRWSTMRFLCPVASTGSHPMGSSSTSISCSNCVRPPRPDPMQGMFVSAKYAHPADVFADRPIAVGHLTEKISATVYRAHFEPPTTRSTGGVSTSCATLPVGMRVTIYCGNSVEEGFVMSGLIARVNGNATYTMLMENDEIELSVARSRVCETREPAKELHNAKFLRLVAWLRPSISDARDCEAAALILFRRGWRAERMYLLEAADISPMVFLSKVERGAIMEKVQWERDHRNVLRFLHFERVKDRDLRYSLSKYKATISCIVGIIGVTYVFLFNLRIYSRQQRGHQLKLAVSTLTRTEHQADGVVMEPAVVHREKEEQAVRQVLRQLDNSHPRIVVFTGSVGSSKSALCRSAVLKERIPAVFVEVLGTEDTLHSLCKAIGVQCIDVCGDLLDFVEEALLLATQHLGRSPLLVVKVREGGSLEQVYAETAALACDRCACHLLVEVPIEFLTPSSMSLPRLDFYTVPNFTRQQAYEYTQHTIDPLNLLQFIEVVGTVSGDLDELLIAVHQRGMDAVTYTSQKLKMAMRQLQAAWSNESVVRDALLRLAQFPYEEGLPDSRMEDAALLRSLELKEVVTYNPVQDKWMFAHKVLHTAARCWM